MAIFEAEFIKNARKPLELNIEKATDQVTIISDTGMDEAVWSGLIKAARSMGLDPVLILIPQPHQTHVEPPQQVRAAIQASDVCILATSEGLIHTDAVHKAVEKGTKAIAMSEVTPNLLAGPAATADYDAIRETGLRVAKKFNEGTEINIRTEAGTLSASIDGRTADVGAGDASLTNGMAAFPDGEVWIAPIEGTADGTLTWNVTMHEIGAINESIIAEFQNGEIVDLSGGKEADRLHEFLSSRNDPNVYNLAEVAIQTNPDAEVVGRMRTDKKRAGYVHAAIGDNSGIGGETTAVVHLDGVIKNVEFSIDGDALVKDNELLI